VKCGRAAVLHRVTRTEPDGGLRPFFFAPKEGGCRFRQCLCGLARMPWPDRGRRWSRKRGNLLPAAQLRGQGAVEALQMIENKRDKIPIVCLTLALVAVKHPRSLTVSKVFPVGCESGAQTSSQRPPADLEAPSASGTAVPERILARCQQWHRGLTSATPQAPGGRQTNGTAAGGNPAEGQAARTALPVGLPAANRQAR
jgi:hypothetical protein